MIEKVWYLLYIFLFQLYAVACAGDMGDRYSLRPDSDCRASPKAPPKSFFLRSYRTYTYPGPWSVFDINGDGWCDWVRGGYEGHSKDQEEPVLKDFIYLGTSSGWRYYDSPPRKKNLNRDQVWELEKYYLFGESKALNFFEPVPVYKHEDSTPYIVTAIRFDAPAPPPDYDHTYVTRWDRELDGLKEVSSEEKNSVLVFLRRALCIKHPSDLYRKYYGPLMIAQGELCSRH